MTDVKAEQQARIQEGGEAAQVLGEPLIKPEIALVDECFGTYLAPIHISSNSKSRMSRTSIQ